MKCPIQLRRAEQGDASAIEAVLLAAFAEYRSLYTAKGFAATTPTSEQVRARLQEGPVWLALSEGKIVGTAAAVLESEFLYIRGMAVLPAARGKKVGQALLEEIQRYAIEQDCKRLLLSTTPFLDRAIRLYEGFGFRRTGDGPHDLFGTPLFTMEKLLTSKQPSVVD